MNDAARNIGRGKSEQLRVLQKIYMKTAACLQHWGNYAERGACAVGEGQHSERESAVECGGRGVQEGTPQTARAALAQAYQIF